MARETHHGPVFYVTATASATAFLVQLHHRFCRYNIGLCALYFWQKRELKLRKGSSDRNAKAQALKLQRRLTNVRRSLASSLASSIGKEEDAKRESWWNRWQSE